MNAQIFASRLNKLMEMQNKTPKDIEDYLNAPRAAVKAWMSGQKVPRWDKLFHLADYFHVSLAVLVGVEEIPPLEKQDL
ncbi:MAG: helix-turn-helix transcriptional regulator [Bacillota bacterium]|nr:helix-turn-helix transcriptional regulator [Bacillota bacterium]